MTVLSLRLQLARSGFALDVTADLPASGISVLFGTSGSGKSTLLRAIAGLEPAAAGRVALGDSVWQDDARGIRVPVWQRQVGCVFQEAGLFEHLDVAGNVGYGLRWRGGVRTAAERLDALIDVLGIRLLLRRRVATLSGGERQRVAIARAIAAEPRLLLLDEPLAALDFARRDEIMAWLTALQAHTGTPVLYVTHAIDELARLADYTLVLDQGRLVAAGEPAAALRAAGLVTIADRLTLLRAAAT